MPVLSDHKIKKWNIPYLTRETEKFIGYKETRDRFASTPNGIIGKEEYRRLIPGSSFGLSVRYWKIQETCIRKRMHRYELGRTQRGFAKCTHIPPKVRKKKVT